MTLEQLTDKVISLLAGFTRDQDEQTWLSSGVSESATTMTVEDPKLISRGLVEIGDELIWVARVDNNTGAVTIAPNGRGYHSTTPAAHEENAFVRNNPRYPRAEVKSAINDAVEGVYPDLWASGVTEFPAVAARLTYELPADVDHVRRVSWESIGPSRSWLPINRWRFDPDANPGRFPTGKSLTIMAEPIAGRTIRVNYAKVPSRFADDSTDFASATGLPSSAENCVVYGACFTLCGLVENPRLQLQNIESQMRSQLVQPGSSQGAARHFMQLYQLALQSEREKLLKADPTQAHFRYI